MAHATKEKPRPGGKSPFTAIVTLALWQLRRTWRLLLITGAGILTAVVLVGVVPLYSEIATSAGLRDALKAAPIGPTVPAHRAAEPLGLQAPQQHPYLTSQQA